MKNKRNIDAALEIFIKYKALIILLVIMVVAQIASHGLFFRAANISSLSRQIATPILIALGYTVLISSGNMDLSPGELVSLCGIVYATSAIKLGIIPAILITASAAILCGLTAGAISLLFKLPSFITTLAMAQIYTGVAYILCDGKSIANLPSSVKVLGQGLIAKTIPISIVIALSFVLIEAVLVRRTKLGRHLLATGGNAEAAKVSGINTFKVQLFAFAFMGVCCSVSAVVLTGRVGIALPAAGSGLTMDAIAAVAIGGTPMRGGKASVLGSLIGCTIIGIISNVLNLAGVSSFYQWICKGIIILAALLLDSFAEHFALERQRKMASL